MSDCVGRLHVNCRRYQITLRVKYFYTNRERCEVLTGLDIYHWSAGLAVIGRIHDVGQNVLQSSFKHEAVTALSNSTFSSLSHSSGTPLLEI